MIFLKVKAHSRSNPTSDRQRFIRSMKPVTFSSQPLKKLIVQMDKMLTPTVQCISGNGKLYLPLQNLLMHSAHCWPAKVCLTHRIDFLNFVTHDLQL